MDKLLTQMGLRIAARRKELGLTQEGFSEIVGLSEQTISTAECGKKALRPENIVKFSSALNCSTDYLLTGKKDSTTPNELNHTIKRLTPMQYQCLIQIIENFILAVDSQNLL